ncbi:hypothetical protein NMG60_11031658 [Bertholletia excelsa]
MESFPGERRSVFCYPDSEMFEYEDETMEEEEEDLRSEDEEDPCLKDEGERLKKEEKKKKKQVFLEGYVEGSHESELSRGKSLTDEDLAELKGCLDLGFGFSYDEIPELCNTLPALELCYSMSQRFLDEQQSKSPESSSPSLAAEAGSPASGPIANWKISSPGDHPEDVKARLKYWAQAVACTVRLCS